MTAKGRDASDVHESVAAVLADHPVTVGILFGSLARGTGHDHSDVDVAVAFEDVAPGDEGYNDAFFGLSADLATALETDDVDVVDLRRASPTLAQTIFAEGTVLVGTEREVRQLREQLLAEGDAEQSPADRFDDVLAAIDDHLA